MPRPTLVIVVGPGAVGKMTVSHALAKRTGFKVLHNHMTIDPLLEVFPFGSPSFLRLVSEFRGRILDEAVASGLVGLVFTFVWGFGDATDEALVADWSSRWSRGGGRVVYVELQAPQSVRLERDQTEFRLARKPTKRDADRSRQSLLAMDAQFQLDSGTRFDGRDDYLRIDNTHLSADEVADLVVRRFALPSLA